MLTQRTRRNISLVLFIGLMLVSAVVWSMGTTEGGMKDGVFSGQAEGFKGPLTVDVTVSGGKITNVVVSSHEDTPGIANPAIETVTKSIVAAQNSNVDIVAGATYTSKAVIAAAEKALAKASASYPNGVHVASAEGFNGPVKLEVTVEKGAITKVVVLENDETPFIVKDALIEVPAAIVANQTWEVDVFSGATYTSEAIMKAVEIALTK